MKEIFDLGLFVGTKEEYYDAVSLEMSIVCAMNVGNGVSYRSVVGKTGPGHPDYLFKETEDAIYLNLIDGRDPAYISDDLVNAALRFIDKNLYKKNKVFVYCSEGKSRSPSLAFMYLMERGILEKNVKSLVRFHAEYPHYVPGVGMAEYIIKRYFVKK